jgi:quinol-cytochrome oxidoreductase complex cytochrome b subunit
MATKREGWLEERLETRGSIDHFLYRTVPRGVGWWYTLGSATLVTFILLVLTGVFLMMNYTPSPDHAYDSIQYIMHSVPFGSLIRSIHFWSASTMVVLVGLHAMRTFFMAAYKYPRELTWVIGALLFIFVMVMGFTGYLLPWDQKAFWATNVGTGIAGQMPLVGPFVQKVLIGGTTIGATTLTRFFTLHVAILPALIILLTALHIYLVVKMGISAPPRVWGSRR